MTPKRTPGRPQKPVDDESLKLARLLMNSTRRVLRTWDATAAHYGISKAACYRIAKDDKYRPAQATIDKVLAAPSPVPPLVPVPACPDCGSVHHARCHGNGGAVVVLAQGETVRRPGQSKPRRRYCRLCLPATLTPEQRQQVRAYALELAGPVPALEVD